MKEVIYKTVCVSNACVKEVKAQEKCEWMEAISFVFHIWIDFEVLIPLSLHCAVVLLYIT